MDDDLYWDADLSSWPAFAGLRRMVSANVEQAVVGAFASIKIMIVIGDDGRVVCQAIGPDDPRTIGTNCEDLLHVDVPVEEALREGVHLYGEEILDAVEQAIKAVRADPE